MDGQRMVRQTWQMNDLSSVVRDIHEERIFTLDEAALIVDVFENMLEKYGMRLPSPEDDEREEDNGAALYGSTYGDILDAVENVLIGILARQAGGSVVIPGVFSSTI